MSIYDELRQSPAFAELRRVSARLGRDPLQVQGPGGNASLKENGAMLVKASGTWLADAEAKDIMVPVDLERLRADLLAEDPAAENSTAYVPDGENPTGLRPSIETSVHAIFDWPIVIHTHCVATIATAVRVDAANIVAQRLGDLDAAFVGYAKPGLFLARAIIEAAQPQTRVLILGNHGLVVGGDGAEEVEALLFEVSRRLAPASTRRPGAEPGLTALLAGSGWHAVDHPATTAIARDPALLSRIEGSSLYPDHVIFLGPGIFVAGKDETIASAAKRAGKAPVQKLIIFPGLGAALPDDASPAMEAMARCLGDVAVRLDVNTDLVRLMPHQEAELLNWDAEKYRQSLDKGSR